MYLWYVVECLSWHSDETTGYISEISWFITCQRQKIRLSLSRCPHRARYPARIILYGYGGFFRREQSGRNVELIVLLVVLRLKVQKLYLGACICLNDAGRPKFTSLLCVIFLVKTAFVCCYLLFLAVYCCLLCCCFLLFVECWWFVVVCCMLPLLFFVCSCLLFVDVCCFLLFIVCCFCCLLFLVVSWCFLVCCCSLFVVWWGLLVFVFCCCFLSLFVVWCCFPKFSNSP